jgi:TfoX/Sxy family transcriptional regulator of competence genes
MPYDEEIEDRIGKVISRWKNTQAKKMFGGVCHLLDGSMFCGVYKEFLILRLGEEESKEALKLPSVRPFDITGKPMKGWVMVEKEGFKSDEALKAWLFKAKEFVGTLPSKG